MLEYNYSGALHVAHQCTDRKRWECGRTELLYCVASPHSLKSVYAWKNTFGTVAVNSPVLYVKLPGIYHCTVRTRESEVLSKEMVVYEGM